MCVRVFASMDIGYRRLYHVYYVTHIVIIMLNSINGVIECCENVSTNRYNSIFYPNGRFLLSSPSDNSAKFSSGLNTEQWG